MCHGVKYVSDWVNAAVRNIDPKKKKSIPTSFQEKTCISHTAERERERRYGEDEKGELMNYGWPVNREKKRERERGLRSVALSSSSWVMEVSRCECCHADGDPGVLQKRRERRGREKNRASLREK